MKSDIFEIASNYTPPAGEIIEKIVNVKGKIVVLLNNYYGNGNFKGVVLYNTSEINIAVGHEITASIEDYKRFNNKLILQNG